MGQNANNPSTEIAKAICDGYSIPFFFIEGFLCWNDRKYLIKDVSKVICPCIESQRIIYRLNTPDGLRGYAVLEWDQQDET